MRPSPSTKRIVLAGDYGAGALWRWTENGLAAISMDALPLDAKLRRRLDAWATTYDELALTDYAWPSEAAKSAWQEDGRRLLIEVREALGEEYEVTGHFE